MNYESMKIATQLYFTLLHEKIIKHEHKLFLSYGDSEVKEGVRLLADQSDCMVIETGEHLHLVTKSDSVFATNFTHLKKRYKDIENKKYFHVISIILMVFLSMVDRGLAARTDSKRHGLTPYSIEEKVRELLQNWETLLNDNPDLGREKGLDMYRIVELWKNMEVDGDSGQSGKRGNKKTRIGLIMTSLKLFEDEKLVTITDRETVPKAHPTRILFERIDTLYHDYDRYQDLKEWMYKEEIVYAQD
jgi:Family of unknown function (DUF6063)